MGLLRVLFGGGTRQREAHRERYLSILEAAVSLGKGGDLRPTGRAGIVFNPVESPFFDNLDAELRTALAASGQSTGTRFEVKSDSLGTRWVVLEDPDLKDLVSTSLVVSDTIFEHGFIQRLLAAAFKFQFEGKDAYWVYSYKRGSFYPIVPSGERQRDNAVEMRLGKLMGQGKLPVERALEQWYSLWEIPF